MFTPRVSVFLAILSFFVIVLGLRLLDVREADYVEYQRLLESSEVESRQQNEAVNSARQQREKVHKEVRLTDEGNRLHFSLRSESSELVYTDDGQSTDMVENMKGVVCFFQEELYYTMPDGREVLQKPDGRFLVRDEDPEKPSSWVDGDLEGMKPMQRLRYLEAERAVYYYKNNSFVAQEVKLQSLVSEGHTLVESLEGLDLMMKGVAQAVEFTFAGKELNFRAHHLKAMFYSPRGIL